MIAAWDEAENAKSAKVTRDAGIFMLFLFWGLLASEMCKSLKCKGLTYHLPMTRLPPKIWGVVYFSENHSESVHASDFLFAAQRPEGYQRPW
jgi:hypothetical protein